MTHTLGFRPIDDADGPLEPSVFKHAGSFARLAQVETKTFFFEPRKDFFITAGQRLADRLGFCRTIPVRRRGSPTATGRKSDMKCFIRIAFTDQLADIE